MRRPEAFAVLLAAGAKPVDLARATWADLDPPTLRLSRRILDFGSNPHLARAVRVLVRFGWGDAIGADTDLLFRQRSGRAWDPRYISMSVCRLRRVQKVLDPNEPAA